MSFADTVALLFFLSSVVIFLVKILNIMTYEFVPQQRSLKYYGKEISIILFMIVMLSWLFVFVQFSTSAAEINWISDMGLPLTSYLENNIYLSLENIILILTGVFTFIELILLGWSETRSNFERPRSGQYNNRVTPRSFYK